jgi:uncharacterized repeat protein (TIGR03847 family)
MAREIYDLGSPDRFVAGAVGTPGKRSFYLQARKGTRLVTVAIEKAQVAALATRVVALLSAVRRAEREAAGPESVPGIKSTGRIARLGATESTADVGQLEKPVDEQFRVGTMALGWDAEDRVLVLEARAETEEEDDPQEFPDDDLTGPDLVRVRLEADAAEAFAEGALRVVASGRPPCPVCGEPLDPQGHLCARRNGFVH